MDLRRLRAGEWLAAASGAALLVSLFSPWYEGEGSPSGWESLAVLDVLLALIACAAIALLAVTAAQRSPAVPIAMSALVTIAGAVAILMVLVRLLALPDAASSREWGVFLALAGSLGVVAGALLAMRDERTSPERRPIETLPAPRV